MPGRRDENAKQAYGKQLGIGGNCFVALLGIISILNWNCQGLRNPRTINALKRAWNKEAPIYVFLMETKLTTEQLNNFKQYWTYN